MDRAELAIVRCQKVGTIDDKTSSEMPWKVHGRFLEVKPPAWSTGHRGVAVVNLGRSAVCSNDILLSEREHRSNYHISTSSPAARRVVHEITPDALFSSPSLGCRLFLVSLLCYYLWLHGGTKER